eukprot:g5385.t1
MQSEEDSKKPESCLKYFDAVWWCFTPAHQIESYYINGQVDTCDESVKDFFNCLRGKLKVYKDKSPRRVIPSIWEHRTVDEAREFWKNDFKDVLDNDDDDHTE